MKTNKEASGAVWRAVYWAVAGAVDEAVYGAVSGAVYRTVDRDENVDGAVYNAVVRRFRDER